VVLVKLGGSLITDKKQAETPRQDIILRLAEELVRGRDRCAQAVILGHGSGSFGHVEAARAGLRQGQHKKVSAQGLSRTQLAARRLHELVLSALEQAGASPYSLPPSALCLAASGRLETFSVDPILAALTSGLLPVLYGDAILDQTQGGTILSTEALFEALAPRLQRQGMGIRRVIWLGGDEGVYDSHGRLLKVLSPDLWQRAKGHTGGSKATDVTGGMRLKAETALRMARLGVPSWIGSGLVPHHLERALAGEDLPGTRVEPESWIQA
jgi:isopentenyl phosphate kinase